MADAGRCREPRHGAHQRRPRTLDDILDSTVPWRLPWLSVSPFRLGSAVGAPTQAHPRRHPLDCDQSVLRPTREQLLATYLLSTAKAYTLYLVNSRETEILGQPVYPSLQDLPEVPDMVGSAAARTVLGRGGGRTRIEDLLGATRLVVGGGGADRECSGPRRRDGSLHEDRTRTLRWRSPPRRIQHGRHHRQAVNPAASDFSLVRQRLPPLERGSSIGSTDWLRHGRCPSPRPAASTRRTSMAATR